MNVVVNGEARRVADDLTLDTLLHDVAGTTRGSAAAVDGEVIPRSEWTSYRLHDGQQLEVSTAVQGG